MIGRLTADQRGEFERFLAEAAAKHVHLNWLECWFLRRLLRKVSVQGAHFQRTEWLLIVLYRAWREEFTEDVPATTRECLRECLENAMHGADQ